MIVQPGCGQRRNLGLAGGERRFVDARGEREDGAQAGRQLGGTPIDGDLIGDDRVPAEDPQRRAVRGQQYWQRFSAETATTIASRSARERSPGPFISTS